MKVENKALVLDFLKWIGAGPKPYQEVMDAWRTSCPRLSVWEDSLEAGLVVVKDLKVYITVAGLGLLAENGVT